MVIKQYLILKNKTTAIKVYYFFIYTVKEGNKNEKVLFLRFPEDVEFFSGM